MSLKSILCSIFAVLIFLGMLFGTIVLFGINIILGIVGIVVIVTVPSLLIRKAISSAQGVIDKLIAKAIVPIAIFLGTAAILLGVFLGGWF